MLGEQIIKIILRVPENFTKNTQGVLINIGIIIVIILLESLLGEILTKIEKNNEGKAKISAFIIIILAIAGIYTLLALILDIIVVLLK